MSDNKKKDNFIRLADYQSPDWLVEGVELCFELKPDQTKVICLLTLKAQTEELEEIVLLGESIQLQSVYMDGVELSVGNGYALSEGVLSIQPSRSEHLIKIINKINPAANTSLEGLYMSDGMFCTQCEAEGFRRITYFPDRPDVLSTYKVKLIADKETYPVLLSNGHLIEANDLEDGRHEVLWVDPFPKPSYLFALVGGDLALQQDQFVTCSGREILLEIYTDHHNEGRGAFALECLKRAMKWDEDVYGREYDLDRFMIVAVDSFNMGAMENKGLNIFNSSCVIASPETSTDDTFLRIEAIVAHEYFHNWSGNRVTCRDWFQLSLKEGFTVFRDAEFSADMHDRAVKRIEDVRILRANQFPEDAGPLAHPVRPDAYMEISNFYTLTIYEKGAELVRMLHEMLGKQKFRQATDLYFDRYDGQAVRVEEFLECIKEVGELDTEFFMRWYEQPGTPLVSVRESWDEEKGVYRLTFSQSQVNPVTGEPQPPVLVPIKLGLIDQSGKEIESAQQTFEVDDVASVLSFPKLASKPVPSLLRGFSAPIRLDFPWKADQLEHLIAYDTDDFVRWESYQQRFLLAITSPSKDDARVLVGLLKRVIADESMSDLMKAELLKLPEEAWLQDQIRPLDPVDLAKKREALGTQLAMGLRNELWEKATCYSVERPYAFTSAEIGQRALASACLQLIGRINNEAVEKQVMGRMKQSTCFSDEMMAFSYLVNFGTDGMVALVVGDFYEKWQEETLVMNAWLGVQAGKSAIKTFDDVVRLTEHDVFNWKNPNKVRALLGAFSRNTLAFHAKEEAYGWYAEQVHAIDRINPQIASRMVTPLTKWKGLAEPYQGRMYQALEGLSEKSLSKDLFEPVSKSVKP